MPAGGNCFDAQEAPPLSSEKTHARAPVPICDSATFPLFSPQKEAIGRIGNQSQRPASAAGEHSPLWLVTQRDICALPSAVLLQCCSQDVPPPQFLSSTGGQIHPANANDVKPIQMPMVLDGRPSASLSARIASQDQASTPASSLGKLKDIAGSEGAIPWILCGAAPKRKGAETAPAAAGAPA